MYGGKKREKNGSSGNKKSKQIGIHYVAKGTPDCGLKVAVVKECDLTRELHSY